MQKAKTIMSDNAEKIKELQMAFSKHLDTFGVLIEQVARLANVMESIEERLTKVENYLNTFNKQFKRN